MASLFETLMAAQQAENQSGMAHTDNYQNDNARAKAWAETKRAPSRPRLTTN